jgi:hypothetical protein
MMLTNSNIAYRRLHNQGLSKIIFKDANNVVTQLGAVQAQDYAGAKWAIAQRTKGLTDAEMDRAFADGTILRTHLMRPTWHFVTPADIRWMLMLTAPRVHAVNAFMYRQLELNKAEIKKSYTILEKTLRGNKQLTRTELGSTFEKAGIIAMGQRLSYFMMSAELDGIICSGARKGKQFTYALLEERVPQVKELTRDEALSKLVKRYFATRGPATLQDFTMWSGLTLIDAKNGIEMVKAEFGHETMNGQTYWFSEVKLPAKVKSPTAYLLANYDEYFIGFKDRSAIGDVAKQAGIKGDDPSLIAHIVIINGQIVGGWKRSFKKNEVVVELNLFANLSKAEHQAITAEAQRFGKFIGMPVTLT